MTINFFKLGGLSKSIQLKPTDSLSVARQLLGEFMPSDYRFLLVHMPGGLVKALNIENEPYFEIKMVRDLNQSDNASIVDIGSHSPIFIGKRVNWFSSRFLQVGVNKNMSDQEALVLNNNQIQPVMLDQIRDVEGNYSRYLSSGRVVLFSEGTAMEFIISCWASLGYGLSIDIDYQPVVKAMYVLAGDQPGRQMNTIIRESWQGKLITAQKGGKSISSRVSIKAWNVLSYEQNGRRFVATVDAPAGVGDQRNLGGFVAKSGLSLIEKGLTTALPNSGNTEAGSVSIIDEDRNDILGQVEMSFFSFDDPDQMNSYFIIGHGENFQA